MIIVWIEYLDNIFRQIVLLYCLLIIPFIKRVKAKAVHWLRIPYSQGIHNAVAVADNRQVIRNRLYRLIVFLIPDQSAVFFSTCYVSAKFNHFGILRTAQFKWIAITKPVIWHLSLKTVADLLLKHTITVADTTAIRRIP